MGEVQAVETESNMSDIGHNSERLHPQVLKYFQERIEVEVIRKSLNTRMSRARKTIKDVGMDVKGVDARYQYHKQKLHDREGYDESAEITEEALNKANTGELFAPLYEVVEE